MNKIARGIITPILTPMYDDESINYEELKNQVERLVTAGVSGLFVFGTNGESYVLNEEERRSVLKTVVEQTAKRVPVFAGTGFPGTKETIRQSLNAQKLGADAALKAQKSLIPLRNTFKYGNPNTMIKCATRMLGYPVGSTSAPFNAIPPEGIEALCKVLEDGTRLGME